MTTDIMTMAAEGRLLQLLPIIGQLQLMSPKVKVVIYIIKLDAINNHIPQQNRRASS